MTSADDAARDTAAQESVDPDREWATEWEKWADATEASLAASEDARFLARERRGGWARSRLIVLAALALLVHSSIIAVLLWRDKRADMKVAALEETPVEVVVEPPKPEQPKPPPPKPPEPPKPKPNEDLSPAMSAPRAPTETKVDTPSKVAKTAAPNKADTAAAGQPKEAAEAAPPKPEIAPPEPEKDEAAKEEDKKPDAEALDKAKPKAAKKTPKTREAKASPRHRAPMNALAALATAPSLDAAMSFAKPTPKAKIYGGTEDMRWMSEVEAMLEARVQQLPRTAHYQAGGKVALCFHVDPGGRVIFKEYCQKSGYPDVDALAMRALDTAGPFPAPPPGLERGLVWVSTFDGQVPVLHFR